MNELRLLFEGGAAAKSDIEKSFLKYELILVDEGQDWLEDEGKNQEQILAETEELDARTKLLNEALEKLDSRERHILSQRKLIDTPKTLDELSKEYSVSRERIRQIEARAFEKLQKNIKELAINNNLWPE